MRTRIPRLPAIVAGLLLGIGAIAQPGRDNSEQVISSLLEKLIENTEIAADHTDLREQLEFYHRNKLNLNRASAEQLQRLVFLDGNQVNALIDHRQRFGDFMALYELQSIDAIDELTRYYLCYFVTIDETWQEDQTSFRDMLQLGRHEMIALFDTELQQRQGYRSGRKEAGLNYYRGSQHREVVRYRFSYGNRLSFGYSGEKDMGEPFAAGAQRYGFDFNSLHFYYRPRKGLIKAITLGDYQASFGQGLTFGSGLASRKSAFVLNIRRNFVPLRPYRSLNENEFLRGAAVTLARQQWQAVLFASASRISTDLQTSDSLQDAQTFGSVSFTGLHRTESEAARRKNVLQQVYGAHVQWENKNAHLGFTHAYGTFGSPLLPGDKPYQLYRFSGVALYNTGIDYGFRWRNANFFGELSRSDNRAHALVSGIIVSLDKNLDMAFLYRNYARDYRTVAGNAFGEYSDGRNEQGIYTGASLRLSRRWALNAYIDLFRSGWLRYLTDAPSRGTDLLSELQYNPSKTTQFCFRYRQEIKQRNQPNQPGVTDYLSDQSRTAYRFHVAYKVSPDLSAKSRMETIVYRNDQPGRKTGTVLFQDLSWSTPRRQFSIALRVAYFSVDDYNARVYATEQDVPLQYPVALYQNSGIRYYAMAHFRFSRRLDLWVRFSETVYSNIDTIGSGLEQIDGNKVSDLRLQLRVIL